MLSSEDNSSILVGHGTEVELVSAKSQHTLHKLKLSYCFRNCRLRKLQNYLQFFLNLVDLYTYSKSYY
jgi:hypothetical protein